MRGFRASAESRHDDEPPATPGAPTRTSRPRGSAHPGAPGLLPGRLRPRTVRAKVVSLLMVPVVSLMALWAFATVTTAQTVSDLARFKEANATLLAPVGDYLAAVQTERSAAARYLADPDPSRLDNLNTQGRATDAAAAGLRRGVNASSADTGDISPELPDRIARLTRSADGLGKVRESIAADRTDWTTAYERYTRTIDLGFAVGGALTGVDRAGSGRDGGADASGARVVRELSLAREMLAREDAAVGAARADGHMPAARYRLVVGAAESRRTLLRSAVDDLRPADETAVRTVLDGRAYRDLLTVESAVIAAGPGRAAPQAAPASWDEAAVSVLQDLRKAERSAGTSAAHRADPFAFDVLGSSGIAVILGLAGVLLSLLISVRIGRGLVLELVGMRNSALDLAGRRLPQSLRRLHAGEEVDVEAEAPVRSPGEDEIGQVGAALNAVHRAAVTAAAERAEVLSGISGVYVKLARRSQVLLHRQLELLDTMERRTENPAELEDLFRLDHLTTRMRRHAESLIILSGAAPVRGWRRPVPVLDVVRAAVAEVEDFARVAVDIREGTTVSGAAVADLTHLVAELVENAVVFSPPHTMVQVRGERVGAGLALEIEDRGLGMSQDAFAEANRKIEDASQVDLLDTDRLGLFVVNRLAHRRGIQVSLRRSPYGGVTAVVLVPEGLLEQEEPGRQQQAGAAGGNAVEPGAPAREQSPPARREAEPAQPAARNRPVHLTRRPPSVPPRTALTPARDRPVLGAGGGPGGADGATPRPPATPPGPPAIPSRPPSTGPRHAAIAPAPSAGGPAPLPQRVRQASLAPQLRDATDRPARRVPHIADPATGRSPEQARATMAALRSGWLSGGRAGRQAADDGRPPAVGDPTNSPRTSRGEEA
ncbi:sensor histidine kinase [Streptomyces meridianus]|uniref:histidine kinase n=1 Tax=Streptomyces meridianus TaxID=2938945 RepID=A0ABT0X4Z6_9ACTN|nr:nitrate- and nitrite sensing domain-containing protein [Streptomyces meridianus]MCM2577614.1 nitrate- and nitrite sensing domain-containing protein [Streptomyces meridianus]